MTRPETSARSLKDITNAQLFPALNLALLTGGAAIHGNPALLRPLLHAFHTLATSL